LIGQEELAARAASDLQCIQQAINGIVMADVGDGILVLGRDGRVFAANPAARRMLGLEADPEPSGGFRWPRSPPWNRWRRLRGLAGAPHAGAGGSAGAFVTIKPWPRGAGRRLPPGARGATSRRT
jgi:two-component system sensor histidine kinase PilS (NtrC family)